MTRKPPAQLVMTFGWGGWRPGAGRKPSKRRDKIVLHRVRPGMSRRHAAHVTLKVRAELTSLRTKSRVQVIRRAFVGACNGDGFRIVDWSIMGNHLHLVASVSTKFPQVAIAHSQPRPAALILAEPVRIATAPIPAPPSLRLQLAPTGRRTLRLRPAGQRSLQGPIGVCKGRVRS